VIVDVAEERKYVLGNLRKFAVRNAVIGPQAAGPKSASAAIHSCEGP
jgi:hypothetical protein